MLRASSLQAQAFAALLLAAALAGCADSEEPAGEESADGTDGLGTVEETEVAETSDSGEYDEDTCAIEGVVVNDELAAVAAARLTIAGDNVTFTAESAQDGSFSFSFIPTGTWLLNASKSNFLPYTQNIFCLADSRITGLPIQMIPTPATMQPYHIVRDFGGMIGCSAGTPGLSLESIDYCRKGYGSGLNPGLYDSHANISWKVDPLPANVTGVVWELEWDSTSGLSENLVLKFRQPRTTQRSNESSNWYGNNFVKGPSPLRIAFESFMVKYPIYQGDDVLETSVAAASSSTANVTAAPPWGGASGLVMQQSFHIWVTLFYNGYAVPEGWSVVAG